MTTIGARYRLRLELRAIVSDLLGRCEADELPADVAAWIDETTEAAVAAVCDSSLALLTSTLDSLVARAPIDVIRRLDTARVRQGAGIA